MKAVIKVLFNASKESFENFGNGKYIIHLTFDEDADSTNVVSEMLSRRLGVPPSRVSFLGRDARKNWVFELS